MSLLNLENLALTAPDLVAEIRADAGSDPVCWPPAMQADLVEEILWALPYGQAFGSAYAMGLVKLGAQTSNDQVRIYCTAIHAAAANGLTLAQIMAEHFLMVLLHGSKGLDKKFQRAVETMLSKGTYTLKPPLEGLTWLLKNGRQRAADAYLDLLIQTFSKEISYNVSLKFSYLLPKSIRSFEDSKAHFQIVQLTRVVNVDFVLAERFLTGLQEGLFVLDEISLERFVSLGLEKYHDNAAMGRKFLAVTSQAARDLLEELQVSVLFVRVRPFLERAVAVRLGRSVPLLPISQVQAFIGDKERQLCYIFSDSKHIYLTEEISDFQQKHRNEELYKILTKLESTALEFGTYDFDIDKLDALCKAPLCLKRTAGKTDFEIFWERFEIPELARDLFNIMEQGRLRCRLEREYAGLARRAYSFLQELIRSNRIPATGHFLHPLYLAVALGMDSPVDESTARIAGQCNAIFKGDDVPVEISACLTLRYYDQVAEGYGRYHQKSACGYDAFLPLYGRRIQPALLQKAWAEHDRTACRIREKLKAEKIEVYVSDLRRELVRKNGAMTGEDLSRIIIAARKNSLNSNDPSTCIDVSAADLNALLEAASVNSPHMEAPDGNIRRYKEWDSRLSDYIHNHVRVVDQTLSGGPDEFYARTLAGRAGLVTRMRKAFEMLKPEGLILLRRWIEGDDFDYRALLDFAIDKRAGIMPSNRLYIKRIKQNRDVAVLLLVDVSRSTANCIAGTQKSVLSVQKEAIVLFCEALNVVGDDFAVAGFSGSGRLNVDYFRFKDFDDSLTEKVKQRIGSIAPQRSTRMGAAIRHGTCDLERLDKKVRLMLILSDGFPNDAGYKGAYAVADTRMAILEARAKNIVVKAITVNMGSDLRLNDLYGSAHHHVIEDVRDLPDKLLRMYGNLTRQ